MTAPTFDARTTALEEEVLGTIPVVIISLSSR
jgi:hypothetical protein